LAKLFSWPKVRAKGKSLPAEMEMEMNMKRRYVNSRACANGKLQIDSVWMGNQLEDRCPAIIAIRD